MQIRSKLTVQFLIIGGMITILASAGPLPQVLSNPAAAMIALLPPISLMNLLRAGLNICHSRGKLEKYSAIKRISSSV